MKAELRKTTAEICLTPQFFCYILITTMLNLKVKKALSTLTVTG